MATTRRRRQTMLTHPGTVAEQLADMLMRPPARLVHLVNDAGRVVGEGHHRAKLTDHDIWLIHQLRAEGMTCREIATKFEVSWHTVKSISAGRRRGQTATGQRT